MSRSYQPSRSSRALSRRWSRLILENLEERIVPTGIPPETIVPPTAFTNVLLGSLSGDALGNGAVTNGEVDYYRFTANTSAEYRISARTPSSSLDTVVGLFDANGNRVAFNDDITTGVDKDSEIVVTLTGGQRYYFGVTNYDPSTSGAYTWRIDGPADDSLENNDTRQTARNFGTLTTNKVVSGLRMADVGDWYRFTMKATGTDASLARIDFTNADGDLDLRLFNSAGTQIDSSTSTSDSELVSLDGLAAGTYYLQVTGFNRTYNPNYKLTIRPGIADDSSENNDSLGAASDLGTLSAASNTLANRRMADTQDWFRFTMAGPGSDVNSVSISFTHSLGDLDLKLYDSAGTLLATSDGTTDGELISLADRAAGTYYVQVYGYKGAVNPKYSLNIKPGGADDAFENNDTRAAASNLGTVTALRTLEHLVMADDDDWYKFTMPGAGGVGTFARLEFQHTDGDLDLALVNAAGTQLRISEGVSDNEQISLDGLAAGTYYLHAYGFEGAHNDSYSLVINPGIADDSSEDNDTRETARNLGTLSANKTVNNLVMADAADWFKFTTVAAGTSANFVRINFTHASGDLDLELYDDAGNRIGQSTGTENFEQIALDGRAAGTYFVKAFGYSGATNRNYSLVVNVSAADDIYEDNDSRAEAKSLGIVSANRTVAGLVMADSDDWFSFTTTRAGTSGNYVRLLFTHARGDLDFELYDAGGTRLLTSTGSADNEQLSLTGLAAGSYSVHVYGYNGANNPAYSLAFNVAAGDWFTTNLDDASLQSLGRDRFGDGSLSRSDMLALFDQVEADGSVSATEFADLKRIITGAATLNLSEAVRNLANKVINGDRANARYQGETLGNLQAGSAADVLDRLVDKWFLGLDHPLAQTKNPLTTRSYALASGSLFVSGATYQDVVQGAVGDCYFLAGLAATAFRSPSNIKQMFIDNGDNTYTVRFYNNGVADYVTVDRHLPVNGGFFVFANGGDSASNSSNELWVALAEKAYAQLNESAWLRAVGGLGGNGINSYQAVAGGFVGDAIEQINGTGSAHWSNFTATNLIDAFNAGKLICFSSKGDSDTDIDANGVVQRHAYTLVGYDAGTQKFTLFNPWGVDGGTIGGVHAPGLVQLTFAQILQSYVSWDLNTN